MQFISASVLLDCITCTEKEVFLLSVEKGNTHLSFAILQFVYELVEDS